MNRCAIFRRTLTIKLSLTLNPAKLNWKSLLFWVKYVVFIVFLQFFSFNLIFVTLIWISISFLPCVYLFICKYKKIRQLLQTIRENIEKMRIYTQKMSNAYQASVEKCKHIFRYFFFASNSNWVFIWFNQYVPTIYCSSIEKYGKTSVGKHNGVPECMKIENLHFDITCSAKQYINLNLFWIFDLIRQICLHMENLKNEQPTPDDTNIVACINRFQLGSVQDEFFEIWKQYECFLRDYEKRVKMKLQRTAKIGKYIWYA